MLEKVFSEFVVSPSPAAGEPFRWVATHITLLDMKSITNKTRIIFWLLLLGLNLIACDDQQIGHTVQEYDKATSTKTFSPLARFSTPVRTLTLTAVPTLKPTSTSTPTNTLLSTPTPLPNGIVYYEGGHYWQLKDLKVIDADGPETPSLCPGRGVLSPDGAYCLENGEARLYPTITELSTGKEYPLDIYPDYAMCCAMWWEGNPGYVLVEVQPGTEMIGMGYQTILAYTKSDGTGLTLIGHEPTSTGPSALATGGQQIAFEEAGIPWLFTWGQESRRFDLPFYGFPELDEAYFGLPSWSPSNRKLVWTVIGSINGEEISGFGIFDLEGRTSALLYPYDVSGSDMPLRAHGWSPDEKYITLDNEWSDSFWIIAIDGTQSYRFPEYEERMWVVWQPSMKHAIVVMGDWHDKFENWLLDLTSWDINKLELPSGAYVVGWKE